jgi:hypothetical protein
MWSVRYRGYRLPDARLHPDHPAPSWGPLLDAVDRRRPVGGDRGDRALRRGDGAGLRDEAVGLVLGSELIVEIETLPRTPCSARS